jgi:regulator of protease activity HflC (stomatin/prohibitin superfamily)
MRPLQELQEAEEAEAEEAEAEEAEAEEAEAEAEEAEAEAEAEEAEAEAEEAEAEEAEAEEAEADKQIPLPCLASGSVETPPKYSQEKERKQTASSPNSNAITWPISESQSLTPGSERSSSPAPIFKAPSSTNGSTEL